VTKVDNQLRLFIIKANLYANTVIEKLHNKRSSF